MVHEVQMGKRKRMSFSKIREVIDMPDLIEVQKKSYERFFEVDLREVLNDISPIVDFSQKLVLEFVDYYLDKNPKYDVDECKERDATYSSALKVRVRLTNKETGEISESDVFMGDFPLMTEQGTFIINGAERVIVSQLVRSPGAYYGFERDKSGKVLYTGTAIPNRGAWLEFETDSNGCIYVRVDRTRKIPVTVFLRALGYGSDEQLYEIYGSNENLEATIVKDSTKNEDEGLIELYKRLRPGEPPTVDSAKTLLNNLFFDPKRYDFARVGRYKFNKKLRLGARIAGKVLARPLINMDDGEVILDAGQTVSRELANSLIDLGINEAYITVDDKEVKVFGNGFCNAKRLLDPLGITPEEVGINECVHTATLKAIIEEYEGKPKEELIDGIKLSITDIIPKHIIRDDILAVVNYIFTLNNGVGEVDDIDHLGNRRLRSVGELLQNQIRIGFTRLERVVRERMSLQNDDVVTPGNLINVRPVTATIKEFFGSSQLSQFMDQNNPLAELTHKRRLSALGPGGLNRDRASFEVRDVHHSHYGRMCPIETPEGPNIGLIGSLSTFAKINEYGFIETPYRKVDKAAGAVTDETVYLTADEEDNDYVIAQANAPIDENGKFINERVTCRKREEIVETLVENVDFMDVSPKQVVSVATAMIPFLENDDANRALMGANMQRQAVPLLTAQAPIVATGMEYKAAKDSGVVVLCKGDGVVESVCSDKIVVNEDSGEQRLYKLRKFSRSNQGTCINQKPIVAKGDVIKVGDIIADGPSTDMGEISLGKNILMGFMMWEGYNYEDAILISEKLVKEDTFTSIHIEKFEAEAHDTKLGAEEITRDIPNVGEEALKNLDISGIIRVGAEVTAGDILVGKVTPKGETELTAEEKLIRAIFGEKAREVRDTSLRVPHGESGIVVDVKIFTRENKDELPAGVNKLVRVYIAQKRKISVGDKMAGRHGNKGVVSRILPEEDMPFLPDGTPLQIVLNPLGVPSRMNIGQVLEVHLGYAAKALGWHIATPVFDGANETTIAECLEKAGYNVNGKTVLYDGRTGERFENEATVGYMYILKLHHLVDDKIHARSTGPYSLVTQQPLGGKAQFGGQRFGEMEVWALEAYGAANTLQEILTVKSDDIVGRVKTYESIVKGENIPKPGIPESFKVLIKELQSLCLDIKTLNENMEEISLSDDEDTMGVSEPLNISIDSKEDEPKAAPVIDDKMMDEVEIENLDVLLDLEGLEDLGGDDVIDVVTDDHEE